jgi:peroxiredoxin
MRDVVSKKLPLGWLAPDWELPTVTGEIVNLAEAAGPKGLVIVFLSQVSPSTQGVWRSLRKVSKLGRHLSKTVVINPMANSGRWLDSVEHIHSVIEGEELEFPYLLDEDSKVANRYEIKVLPEAFLFQNVGGGKLSLFFHGRVNDNLLHPQDVQDETLLNAVMALTAGKKPPLNQPAAHGEPFAYES